MALATLCGFALLTRAPFPLSFPLSSISSSEGLVSYFYGGRQLKYDESMFVDSLVSTSFDVQKEEFHMKEKMKRRNLIDFEMEAS